MRHFHAPGRINLIGDHIDYMGGTVLPMAIDRGTDLSLERRDDTSLHARSANFPGVGDVVANMYASEPVKDSDWANYLVAVAFAFRRRGHDLPHGYDVVVDGNIPNGAGLSSSASIELAFAVAINADLELGLPPTELATLCQLAENEFIGVECGIMDQLAIAAGKKGCALAIDCQTLDVEPIPFPSGIAIVVANTNKRRELAGSEYNQRREACEAAQRSLAGDRLVDLSSDQLDAILGRLDEITARRVKHVVTEQARVLLFIAAMRNGDLALMGDLMHESHVSLRDGFEVTGPELDALAESAWNAPGVIGARMTGAGFGGCTVNLVQPDSVDEFEVAVANSYESATGLQPSFYRVSSDEGAREVSAS